MAVYLSKMAATMVGIMLKHRYNYAKGYMEIDFYGRHFVLKRTRTSY